MPRNIKKVYKPDFIVILVILLVPGSKGGRFICRYFQIGRAFSLAKCDNIACSIIIRF